MRAVVGHRFGGIDDLVYEDAAAPALKPGTIRIDVRAAGVSFANLLFIAGKHQNRPSIPFIPGTEIGGIVSEIAPDVRTGLKVGDRVCAGCHPADLPSRPSSMRPTCSGFPIG